MRERRGAFIFGTTRKSARFLAKRQAPLFVNIMESRNREILRERTFPTVWGAGRLPIPLTGSGRCCMSTGNRVINCI